MFVNPGKKEGKNVANDNTGLPTQVTT